MKLTDCLAVGSCFFMLSVLLGDIFLSELTRDECSSDAEMDWVLSVCGISQQLWGIVFPLNIFINFYTNVKIVLGMCGRHMLDVQTWLSCELLIARTEITHLYLPIIWLFIGHLEMHWICSLSA